MRAQFITASEVAEIMGISRSKAYQIVREMNRELKMCIRDSVPPVAKAVAGSVPRISTSVRNSAIPLFMIIHLIFYAI